jgi:hypothetical protein
MEFEDYLIRLRLELLNPPKNDVLVNIEPGKNAVLLRESFSKVEGEEISLKPSALVKRLIKRNNDSIKKTGISTIGIANSTIQFELSGISYYTPLLIHNARATFNRVREEFDLYIHPNPYFNPFLEKLLELEMDLNDFTILEVQNILKDIGLNHTYSEEVHLGNFHPHRFVILREVEELTRQNDFSEPLNQLFGNALSKQYTMDLPAEQISFSDGYQQAVLTSLKSENIVLQGPPGTGKSDVIANAVAKTMALTNNTLLVAEHQTALNVILEKLKTHDLHHFCGLMHHQLTAKDFVQSLKDTWLFLENSTCSPSLSNNRSYYLVQQLQMLLDRLNANSLYGGMEYSEFYRLCQRLETGTLHKLEVIPDLTAWLQEKPLLEEIFPVVTQMSVPIWTFIHPNLLLDKSKAVRLIEELAEISKAIGPLLKRMDEIDTLYQQSLYAQLFFYDDRLLDLDLFKLSSKKYNRFLELYNKLKTCEEKLAHYRSEQENWKKDLSESELLDFISVLSSKDKFSLPNWLKKRAIKQHTSLSFENAKTALEKLLELKKIAHEQIIYRAELRELDLPDDIQSLTQIHLLIQRSTSFSDNSFKAIVQQGDGTIRQLYDKRKEIQFLKDFSQNYLVFKPNIEWMNFIRLFKDNQAELFGIANTLTQFSTDTKRIVYQFPHLSLDELETLIVRGHWKYLKAKFPHLTALNPELINDQLDAILNQATQDHKAFARDIIYKIKQRFIQAHELLQIPARKLSPQEQALKVRLRKGKSILVKQFAKSRNHMTPLELLSSEAAEWISIVKPVIAGNSIAVAENLPFKRSSYDLVLFDEASQIHLSHAIGSLFRAKRVLIAGDSQQMPPSSSFNRGANDIDLLSQATFYLKTIQLQHHYRSHHEELITFSNRYFYQNKLRTFPFYRAEYPIQVVDMKGVYANRINNTEAAHAAKIIEEKIKQEDFNFGLVAFSQKQLNAILNHLPKDVLGILMERENDILLSALEDVQGEQCDHLIISLGYGYNEEGKFIRQFGPLNKEGGHRRLNVLMSRARKKITFIRSVDENDFPIAENDGVDMLRKLMVYLSQSMKHKKSVSSIGSNEIRFQAFHKDEPEALNLIARHNVLLQRGWQIKYTF